jgi:hypothetical protein
MAWFATIVAYIRRFAHINYNNNLGLNYILIIYMPGSHLFTLGFNQKKFNSTSRVSTPAVKMGCTKGRGSTTRMFNYCTQKSPNPSLCIEQFITKG